MLLTRICYHIFGMVLSLAFLNSCSNNAKITTNPLYRDQISYYQLIDKMKVYENSNTSSEKEKLVIYVMVYLQEGLKSGKIIKSELNKFSYLFECQISAEGKMEKVLIQNSKIESANDVNFIDYLMQMPQCEFWKSYQGTEKDSITSIFLPLHF